MRPGESFFHVGIIVPELEPALERFSDLLGLTWRDTIEAPTPVLVASTGATDVLPLRFAYSREAPHLEVIQAVPGTPWALAPDGSSSLHHLGFYADDVPAESGSLVGKACPIEAGMASDDPMFFYHRDMGVRIELVSRVAAVMLQD